MNIIERFSKYLDSIEYPNKPSSWNMAGVLRGQHAFYKFDVGGMTKDDENRYYKTGSFSTLAEKMVFEFNDKWIILDIEELNKYVKKNKLKDLELIELISKLDWTIEIVK